ncbi:MAG: AAA family ATPase, partial [Leptospiraceae bacterium]|nr:AAA family ATPase [Leptospiraceae bacterium]
MKDCIEQNWDWRKNYHFLKISFGSGVTQTREDLLVTLQEILDDLERENGLKCTNQSIHGKFTERIKTLSRKTNQKVVVLIDEYDKPILDAIENREIAKQIRDELKNFYSVLKDLDEFLKFVFITGVSKFSKVSLFSGLNHLQDISLNPKYAIICGYTHNELVTTFENQLKETNLEAIQSWYNGYNFLGESVYNPFDVLLYFAQRQLHPYWFETGTPNFLLKIFLEKNFHIANLEELIAFEDLIDTLDVDLIEPENLLFQTGYLTIRSYEEIPTGYLYHLTYPNKEVKVSLNRYFCNFLTQLSSETARQTNELYKAIKKAEISKLYD